MFDASYFQSGLLEHLRGSTDKSTVEVHLLNAHMHRLRGVVEATDRWVVFDAYRQRVDGGRSEQHWGAEQAGGDATGETVRVIVSYDAIAEIVITPGVEAPPRIGFLRD